MREVPPHAASPTWRAQSTQPMLGTRCGSALRDQAASYFQVGGAREGVWQGVRTFWGKKHGKWRWGAAGGEGPARGAATTGTRRRRAGPAAFHGLCGTVPGLRWPPLSPRSPSPGFGRHPRGPHGVGGRRGAGPGPRPLSRGRPRLPGMQRAARPQWAAMLSE